MTSEDLGTEYGIAGTTAPEFRLDTWLANTDNKPLRLSEVSEPIVFLCNFQSWCPGCHSHGFPTLKRIKEHFEATGRAELIKFVAVQTVFEGHEINTADAAVESLERHGLTDIALGHDPGPGPGQPPTIMTDYRTGGTPWTVIIGPGAHRTVLAEGFQVDAEVAIRSFERLFDDLDTADLDTDGTKDSDTKDSDTNDNDIRANETQGTESNKMNPANDTKNPNKPSDAELRNKLTPEQYEVTQHGGTERAFTGEYWDTKAQGLYRCIVCDAELFDSEAKYDSGSGWPSFHSEVKSGSVHRDEDRTHGMVRVEARCASCDAHLGHVFPDGPRPTGERFCMNSASLRLEPTSASETAS